MGQRLQGQERTFEAFCQGKGSAVRLEIRRLRACPVQNLARQRLNLLSLLLRLPEEFFDFFSRKVSETATVEFQPAGEDAQWAADIVREQGKEVVAHPQGFFETFGPARMAEAIVKRPMENLRRQLILDQVVCGTCPHAGLVNFAPIGGINHQGGWSTWLLLNGFQQRKGGIETDAKVEDDGMPSRFGNGRQCSLRILNGLFFNDATSQLRQVRLKCSVALWQAVH